MSQRALPLMIRQPMLPDGLLKVEIETVLVGVLGEVDIEAVVLTPAPPLELVDVVDLVVMPAPPLEEPVVPGPVVGVVTVTVFVPAPQPARTSTSTIGARRVTARSLVGSTAARPYDRVAQENGDFWCLRQAAEA
jgi:hypothetical protein